MPKVSRVGRNRSKAAAAAPTTTPKKAETQTNNPNNEESANNPSKKGPDAKQALSRGQRKRMLKREQYLKREKMVLSTLKLKKYEEQKGRLDGLDAIKDALTETIKNNQQLGKSQGQGQGKNKGGSATPTGDLNEQFAESAKKNKAKRTIAQKELTHFNLVLQHPSFQSDPFATMQQHLKNTLAQQAEQQEIVAKDERAQEAKKTEEKKEARKERIRNAKYEKGRKHRRRRN